MHTSISMFYLFIHLASKPFRLEVDERSDTKQFRARMSRFMTRWFLIRKFLLEENYFYRVSYCSNRTAAVGCTRDVNKNF